MSKSIVKFRTNVQLKNIIGQDLINNDNIAILELVKNSFDAGSKSVLIKFENLKDNDDDLIANYSSASSKIMIQDHGSGMNRRDIIEKWLNIAYSEKKVKKQEFGRLLAGAKGIGRFSCDRLGKYLDIYTKKANDSHFWHLSIDWTSFEIEGKKNLKIQDIPLFIESIAKKDFLSKTGYKPFVKGTILEISKLRSIWAFKEKKRGAEFWTYDALISLRKYLERLINPNQAFGDKNKFEIKIEAKEFLEEDKNNKTEERRDLIINGKIENKIFKALNFKTTSIEAFIDSDKAKKIQTVVLRDKGRSIYELTEDVTGNNLYKDLEGVHIIVYFLNTYAKSFFAKQTGQRSVEFGSIFLFKNGFRVSPYGDEGDDWLGLEVRKGQGQRRFLGTRDIVGRIEIIDPKNIFREVTSREGLVNNNAFSNLKEFFYIILKRLEKYVVEGLRWDSIPEEIQKNINKSNASFEDQVFQLSQEQKDAYALEAIKGILKTRGNKIIRLNLNPDLIYSLAEEEKGKFEELYSELTKVGVPKLNKSLKHSLSQIRKVIEKKDEEIRQLKEKSVLVDSEDLFKRGEDDKDDKEVVALQHHINQSTERIRFYLHELRIKLETTTIADGISSLLDRISFENKKISTLSKFVTKAKFNLVTALVTQDLVKFIKEYVSNVYQLYDHKAVDKEFIDVFLFMKEDFEFVITFRPIDFIIIIDNLLDNAQKANASLVEIRIEKVGREKIVIKFKDNGDGLDPSIQNPERIFDFGFTTTTSGTGIGLYHVRSVLKRMKGIVMFEQIKPKGLEFTITITK